MRNALPSVMAATLWLTGCNYGSDDRPVTISVVAKGKDAAAQVAAATSSGLVRFDREGQIVPGAAARWAILEDGLDYIFRIDDAADLSAFTIARRLRLALKNQVLDPEFAALRVIDSVEAVTATVVEIRLTEPLPDLLPLLARPKFSMGAPAPLRAADASASAINVLRAADPATAPVILRSERVGRAVARFRAGQSSAVLGGTFADLPVARAARLRGSALLFDQPDGLFGLAVKSARLSPAIRTALTLAIDRDRIVAAFAVPGQAKATTIAGSQIEPPLAQRRSAALALLGQNSVHVRVAMPPGPGARLLFALLAQDWRRVGIVAEGASSHTGADLVLIDLVAPPGTLATVACAVSAGCDPHDRLALINPPFIPIATPVRWSLVAPTLDLFTANPLAVHPLDQLRTQH